MLVKGSLRKKGDLGDPKSFVLKKAYQRKPGINEKKKKSLLSLFNNPKKCTVPKTYFDYYNIL